MIKRKEKERRNNTKNRKNLGRRKDEKYSLIAYKFMIFTLFTIIALLLCFITYYNL